MIDLSIRLALLMLDSGTVPSCDQLDNPAACASASHCVFDAYTGCRNNCLIFDASIVGE